MHKSHMLLLAALALPASPASFASTPVFSDQTAASGLTFVHRPASSNPSRPMAAGGAVGDFNGDGYPDLFVIGGGNVADALFLNNGDGTFTDKAAEWGLTALHMGVGATVGDYDRDGKDDIFVTSMGKTAPRAAGGQHKLYWNRGNEFTDIADKTRVNRTTEWPDGYGATFGDFDLDGDLDLYVSGWHGASEEQASRLFRRNDDGTFTNVTDEAGLFQVPAQSFGAVFADINNDRWPDLLIAGDFGTSRVYLNKGDGTFESIDPGTGQTLEDEGADWSIGRAHNAMGTTVGDFNRDGRPDWFVTAIWPTWMDEHPFWGNGLYTNQGNGVFLETSVTAGVNDGGWGWGTTAADFNLDGWQDIIMTNGWFETDPVTGHTFDNDPAFLFINRGGKFDDLTEQAGIDHTAQGRGLLHFDYDLDGDMDLVILAYDDALTLYRNETINSSSDASDSNWLKVRLDTSGHPALAPNGLGAVVRVIAGREMQYFQVTSGGTFVGQSELVAHFGLGANEAAQWVIVEWPDGTHTARRGVPANADLTLTPPPTR
ncbi:MAG: CRTAC1 family protein [Pseudomonadota bacterium]